MALTDAEREYLSQEWRWAESKEDGIRSRHPGSREIEIGTAFVNAAGANVALAIIGARLIKDSKQLVVTVNDKLPVSFKQRPPTVLIRISRFPTYVGADSPLWDLGNELFDDLDRLVEVLGTANALVCERADIDHGLRRTTLYLTG